MTAIKIDGKIVFRGRAARHVRQERHVRLQDAAKGQALRFQRDRSFGDQLMEPLSTAVVTLGALRIQDPPKTSKSAVDKETHPCPKRFYREPKIM